jgi:signal transduction histidine kinase
MGAVAYYSTRHFLITDRQTAALHQAYANAALLRNALASDVPNIDAQVTSLDSGSGTISLLNKHGQWFSTSLTVGEASLPSALRASVSHFHVATQTSLINGSPAYSVGVPLPAVASQYFLVVSLSDTQHTLHVLLAALAAAAALTTILGAGLGLLASRRTMRPLTDVSEAAMAIAGGRLDTRLPRHQRDRDLSNLASSFNEMANQLQERIERDARFTSDVSHELRSPLTTLAASLDLLESRRAQLDPEGQQALDLMTGDIGRFQRLVQDLLEISRDDAGVNDVSFDNVAVGELLRQSLAAAQRIHGSPTRATLTIAPDVELARLEIDKRRFERIMANLIENADHYAGGVSVIVAERSPSTSAVVISVIDEGPGIAETERTKIFDRFYRGDASGQRGAGGGSGLGLALVAEHVHRNRGTITVGDGPSGRGVSFRIELPLAEDDV